MPDKQLFTFRAPVGVAAIVTAGNFPVAVPSWYLVPALLCGNTVVWKPAEYTPATAEAFAQLILHAGFPRGAFQLVLADGRADVRGDRARPRRRGPRQGRVHRLLRGGQADRRALRTPPPVALPRARRQEPARRDARRRPRPRRRGRALQRLRDGRPALHVARHGDRPSRRPRRLPRAVHEGRDGCADRRPDPGRPLRADDLGALRRDVRTMARADPARITPSPARTGSAGSRRRTRGPASSATRRPASTTTR